MSNVFSKQAEDFETYFGAMDITKLQKTKRIAMAKAFEPLLVMAFSNIKTRSMDELNNNATEVTYTIDADYMQGYLYATIVDWLLAIGYLVDDEPYLDEYARNLAFMLTATTIAHVATNADDYFSNDRATFVAENETNAVENYMELRRAQNQGYTKKVWRTMLDKKVRHSHANVEGVENNIDELFDVNGSLMMQPKDSNYGADANEIVNCRCSLKFKR